MFAEVIDGIRAASLPRAYAPNDSPTSAFRSIRMTQAINHKRHEGHKGKTTYRSSVGGISLRTKQEGIALLRCPPAPLVWLPQQFTAPCRNQTSDLSPDKAMAVPVILLAKLKILTRCASDRR